MSELSDALTWRFSLGFVIGVVVGIALMFRPTREAAAEVRARLTGAASPRAVAIIRRIVAKEMSGPGVKDHSARLAAAVFIAGIEADLRTGQREV